MRPEEEGAADAFVNAMASLAVVVLAAGLAAAALVALVAWVQA